MLIDVHQLVGNLALLAGGLLELQCIGQLDGREVTHTLALALYGFDSDRGGEVRLAGAGRTGNTLPTITPTT